MSNRNWSVLVAVALSGAGCASNQVTPTPTPTTTQSVRDKGEAPAAESVTPPKPDEPAAPAVGSREFRAREIYVKACEFFDAKEYQIAAGELARATVLNPVYHQAWFKKGLCHYELHQYATEITCYRRCLEIKPDHVPALQNLAAALFAGDDIEAAVVEYHKILSIDPKHHDALYNLGIAYSDLQEYSLAIQCLRRFVDVYPNDPYRPKAEQHIKRCEEKLNTQR